MLASTRRLDGRIEREEVRLLCDARDRLDDRANFLRAFAELVDDFRRIGDILRGGLDFLDAVVDFLCTLRGVLRCGLRTLGSRARLRADASTLVPIC